MNQRVKLRTGNQTRFSLPLFLLFLFCAFCSFATDHFGDIDITPITLANGNTYHGYHEFRFLIENHSLKPRQVTLIFPDRSYSSGNSVSRLSRTIKIGPASRAMVPLWQPPLPINGNNQLRVFVDDDEAGILNLPNPTIHMNGGGMAMSRRGYPYGYGGSATTPTAILVSRSLNYDDMNRVFNAKAGVSDYSAQMATGAPDSASRSGFVPTAWMPAPSVSGPHWIELNYAVPQSAKGVRIYFTTMVPPGTQIYIKDASGTNLYHTNTPSTGLMRAGNPEFAFPQTTEPVKTVRVEFSGGSPGNIGIDAVELIGASSSAWAADAHASSEATGAYGPSPGMGMPGHTLLRSELPMPEWSESWLSYTPYDAIALNNSDLKALTPAAFNALWSYVECGGNVFVFGSGSTPDSWRSFPKVPLDKGELRTIGLGRCFAFEPEKVSALSTSSIKRITDAVDLSARAWQGLPDEDTVNQTFPVVQNFRVPVRGTVFIMLLFVIAIGPINLIVVSRMNRRTWLLWTIPAISLLTCLTVFVYSFVREGVTPDTRISGLTVLDQTDKRAASIGFTAFYCPLTPSQGLFFNSDTEATPLIQVGNYRAGGGREMDWTQAQHLGRGWVSARVPAHFQLRKSETRRERLEIENQNGQLTVVNGLGATIQSLWFADQASHVYTATNIVAGQKANLTMLPDPLKHEEQSGPRGLLEKCGAQADLAEPISYLQPNTYIAEMDSNPFLENGLGPKAKTARTKSHAVVFGLLESPAKP
jgi:hypothetical protein